jgi:ethanolamine-phosphate phospho-lyase
VAHVGHSHPRLVQAVSKQLSLLNTNSRFLYDPLHNCLQRLLARFPARLSVVTFVNSGTEANDLALQMAAVKSRRGGVVCLEGAYHGISKATMDVSPYKWTEHYPCPPHVVVAPSPCTYRGPFREDSKRYLAEFERLLRPDSGAFISELMQSCAGQVIPEPGFYRALYGLLR